MNRALAAAIVIWALLLPAGAASGQGVAAGGPAAPAPVKTADDKAADLLKALQEQLKAVEEALKNNNPGDVQSAVGELAAELALFQGKPSKADIETLIDTLDQALKVFEGDRSELSGKADSLIAAIVAFQGADRPQTVIARATALDGLVKGANWVKGGVVTNAWTLLGTIVNQLRFVDPAGAAGAMKVMAIHVSGSDAGSLFRPPFEQTSFSNDFSSAHATLDTKLRDSDPVRWFESAAVSLENLLVDASNAKEEEKARNATLRRLILNRPSAMTAAVKAKAALEALTGDYRPAIHVIDAYYGDLVTGIDNKRTCDATQAMKKSCERLPTCSLPANYETALCGYDPIPSAEARLREVAVYYTCHTGGDALWDELARYPARDPFTGFDLYAVDSPAVNYAILNGTTMEIRCPAAAATKRNSVTVNK